MPSNWKLIFSSLLFLALLQCSTAQTALLADFPKLRQLARNSGYIFSGTVISVDRLAGVQGEISTIRVTFHVEHAFRGVRDGETVAIREWAGLWNDAPRYRRGERLFLFLYPPSQLGLTSPVGGSLGRFNVDREGGVLLEPHRIPPYPITASPAAPEIRKIREHDFARMVRRAAEE